VIPTSGPANVYGEMTYVLLLDHVGDQKKDPMAPRR
jgi:hypothetical protein